jgi:uncharacterized membrane protein (DUF2068 family)
MGLQLAGFRYNRLNVKTSNNRLIRLIALFKLLKCVSLIAIGVGAFKLFHADVVSVLMHWIGAFRLDPANRFLDAVVAKASNLSPHQIEKLGLGSFIYAGLFLTEGIGLWMLKRWAEWLTIVITSSLVPVEIYEIHHHLTPIRLAVLAVNIAIVGYLVHRIRSERTLPH